MTLDEMIDLFFDKIGESRTQSKFDDDDATAKINRTLHRLYIQTPWVWLKSDVWLSNSYTALASTSSTTAVVVDDAAGLLPGMSIVITDDSNIEETRIVSMSGTTITIHPPLSNSYAADSKVVSRSLLLPYNCISKISIVRRGSDGERLIKEWQQKVDYLYPVPKALGSPTHYYEIGLILTAESFAAGGSTTTSKVDLSNFSGFEDDYYNGWKVTNHTRKRDAWITDYVYSTKLATLDRPILSQASGDTLTITNELRHLLLVESPDSGYTYRLSYHRGLISPLVSLYDSLPIPDDWLVWVVDNAAAIAKERENPQFAREEKQRFEGFLHQKAGDKYRERDKIYSATPYGIDVLDTSNM